jgi:PPP family 3-phenylpropionic acid transporter
VIQRRLSLLYAVQGAAFGSLMPFPVPLLVERGLGAAQIGLILGITGLAALAAYPIWGVIADGWLGRSRTISLTALVAAAGGVWILIAGSDPVAITAALSLAMIGALAWGPLIDALTLGELGAGSSSYGRIRVWASVGWAIAAIAGGLVWMQAGPAPVFAVFVLGALAVGLIALRAGRPATDGEGEPSGLVPRAPMRSWLPFLLAPLMIGFLVGLFVTSLGEHASWRFISLRILDQGGTVLLVGLAAALPAIVEIPVFASSRGLAARLGLRRLFVSGALMAAVLMALVTVAPEAWMVTGLRTLEGASYALRYMAMVLIVGALLPPHLYAMGQSVAWLVYAGIAPIVADFAGGLVYELLGAPALFALVAAALVLGGGIVAFVLRGPAFGPQRAAAIPEEAPPPPPPA